LSWDPLWQGRPIPDEGKGLAAKEKNLGTTDPEKRLFLPEKVRTLKILPPDRPSAV